MQYRILAHITAYKDAEALNQCITSLLKQTYAIAELLIIDNSPLATHMSAIANRMPLKIQHYPENIGIAGSLSKGIQYAISNRFDFIWTFDQDSTPPENALEKLISLYDNHPTKDKIGIIACVAIDHYTGQKDCGSFYRNYRFQKVSCHSLEPIHECDAVITSGSLINCHMAKNVPLPNTSFFIDAVDFDYCMHIRQSNYKILVLNEVILPHRFGKSRKMYLPFQSNEFYLYLYSPLRYYYVHRNHTYLETRLAPNVFFAMIALAYRLLKSLRKVGVILVFENSQKLLKTYACLKGTVDGVFGRLGKTWY